MPVVVSVLIFIIYYIINNTGYKMARDGQWVVWMGMWTSTAVLAPLGAFLTYKSNNDSVVLNADAYINWFKKVVGIRSVRHLFRKEVIIHDPDYTRIPEELKALSVDCREYADRKGLKRAPNYFKLWMTDSQDEAVEDINERFEYKIRYFVDSAEHLSGHPHPCACPSVPQLLVKLALRYCFPDRLVLLFPYLGIPYPSE